MRNMSNWVSQIYSFNTRDVKSRYYQDQMRKKKARMTESGKVDKRKHKPPRAHHHSRGQNVVQNRRDVDPDVFAYARFADAAYKKAGPETPTYINATTKKGPRRYDYVPSLSHDIVTVYVQPDTREVVTSFRGTDVSDPSDLLADAAIGLGLVRNSSRFIAADEAFQDILDKYPPSEYSHILASHSLGGALNKHVYDSHHEQITHAYNYNPGSSPFAATQPAFINANLFSQVYGYDDKLTSIHVSGDWISKAVEADMSHENIVINPLPNTNNPHSISQFFTQ